MNRRDITEESPRATTVANDAETGTAMSTVLVVDDEIR